MSYEVHITRAADWTESEADPITLFDWLACIDADPELQRVESDGGHGFDSDGVARWLGHPQPQRQPCFDYCEGRISVIDPDVDIVVKMHAIAQQLGARVVGDEGEEYGPGAELLGIEEPVAAPPPPAPRPWWQRLFRPLG